MLEARELSYERDSFRSEKKREKRVEQTSATPECADAAGGSIPLRQGAGMPEMVKEQRQAETHEGES